MAKAKNLFSDCKGRRKKSDPPEPKPKKPPKPKKEELERDPKEATAWRYHQLRSLGIGIDEGLLAWKAIKAIGLLRLREMTVEAVATGLEFPSTWERVYPSEKQVGLMKWKELPYSRCRCRHDASLILDAFLDPPKFVKLRIAELAKCQRNDDVTAIGKDIAFVKGILPEKEYRECVAAGRKRREEVVGGIPL
jgi:hypothetical protein